MWIAPTTDDILSEFTQRELAVIQAIQGAPLSAANPDSILSRVVDEIRDNIRSGGTVLDADPATLPRGLISDAVVITRWRLLVATPQLKQFQTDERKDEYDRAMKKQERIAERKFFVEPAAGGPANLGGVVETAQEGNSGNSRGDLSRL